MTAFSNHLKTAGNKLKGIVVSQWVGILVLMLAAVLWLQIPDSHVWQFALSILFALLILLAIVWFAARTARRLRGTSAPLVQVALILLITAVVWLALLYPIGLCREKEQLFAGFSNSKVSPSLRYFFTYNRLLSWQGHLYDLLGWIAAGLLIPPAIEATSFGMSGSIFRRASHAWRSGLYWLVIVIAGFAGAAMTRGMLGWMPRSGLSTQILSLLARLGFVYTAAIFLWCLVLSLAAVCLERAQTSHSAE